MSLLAPSRKQTIRQSLPSFLDAKRSSWENSEASIGVECISIGRLHCWQVIGPALDAMEELSLPIKNLLDQHQEMLEQGEAKPRAMSFNMWMIGGSPDLAEPTIVFSSKSKRQRTAAKALLKDSKLLDGHPGIKIKTLDKMPAIYQCAVEQWRAGNDLQEAVYMVDDSRGLCGALISVGTSKLATMGGVLLINGAFYGISTQHSRFSSSPEPDDVHEDINNLCFDEDSDYDSDDAVEITSKASVSYQSDDENFTDSYGSSPNESSSGESPHSQLPRKPIPYSAKDSRQTKPPSFLGQKISTMSTSCTQNDLDYEIFPLTDHCLHGHNAIYPPVPTGHPTMFSPNNVVRTLKERSVWAATGTTGCVCGTILKTPYFIKMEHSRTFQEMWAVKLDRKTMAGDCGSWVVDALTGNVFGHIVAGDPNTGLAFIIPAYKIFDDIEQRLGAMPVFPSQDIVTPPSRSNIQDQQQPTIKDDLDRCRKTLQRLETGKSFLCAAKDCAEKTKVWPRAENFRQHCLRLHPMENISELMDKSAKLYEVSIGAEVDPGGSLSAAGLKPVGSAPHAGDDVPIQVEKKLRTWTQRRPERKTNDLINNERVKENGLMTDSKKAIGDEEPPTELENQLRLVWSHVLDLRPDQIGLRKQSFLKMGGDSISAMMVVSHCRKRHLGVTVQDVLGARSISHLASFVQTPDRSGEDEEKIDDEDFDLSPIQKLYSELPREKGRFNKSFDFDRLSQSLHVEAQDHQCNLCGEKYAQQDDVRRHIEDGCPKRVELGSRESAALAPAQWSLPEWPKPIYRRDSTLQPARRPRYTHSANYDLIGQLLSEGRLHGFPLQTSSRLGPLPNYRDPTHLARSYSNSAIEGLPLNKIILSSKDRSTSPASKHQSDSDRELKSNDLPPAAKHGRPSYRRSRTSASKFDGKDHLIEHIREIHDAELDPKKYKGGAAGGLLSRVMSLITGGQ